VMAISRRLPAVREVDHTASKIPAGIER
jgi:hypothetical protein